MSARRAEGEVNLKVAKEKAINFHWSRPNNVIKSVKWSAFICLFNLCEMARCFKPISYTRSYDYHMIHIIGLERQPLVGADDEPGVLPSGRSTL